jgi:hypothetical protein
MFIKRQRRVFEGLQVLIPCPVCREHYRTHLTKFPLIPHLDSRADLFKWTIVLHNAVNKSLGKQFSEHDAIEFYKRIGARGEVLSEAILNLKKLI